MGSVYDILCLILYIECSISYKYLKLCSNIWIRVGMLSFIYVLDISNFQEMKRDPKGGDYCIKGRGWWRPIMARRAQFSSYG